MSSASINCTSSQKNERLRYSDSDSTAASSKDSGEDTFIITESHQSYPLLSTRTRLVTCIVAAVLGVIFMSCGVLFFVLPLGLTVFFSTTFGAISLVLGSTILAIALTALVLSQHREQIIPRDQFIDNLITKLLCFETKELELQGQLRETEKLSSLYLEKIKRLGEEVHSLEKDRLHKLILIASLQETIKSLTEELQTLKATARKQQNISETTYHDLLAELSLTKEELKQEKYKSDERKQFLEQEALEQSKTVTLLRHDNAVLQTELSKTARKLKSLEEKISSAGASLSTENVLQILQDDEAKQTLIKKQETEINNWSSDVERLLQDKFNLSKALDLAKSESKKASEENLSLKREVETLKQEIESLKKETLSPKSLFLNLRRKDAK